jgi:hypothetical protein
LAIPHMARSVRYVIMAVAAALTLSGCSTIRRTFHIEGKDTKAAQSLQVLQIKNQRFADEYVGSIVVPIRQFQASTDNAADRLTAQDWMLSQATAAYTNASGPSPIVNAVDLVVLASLSRMVIDDPRSSERFGEGAAALRQAYQRLEPIALDLAKSALPPDQIAALQDVIVKWHTQNPQIMAISYVHFRDVASSVSAPSSGRSDSFSGLFSMLGLDPLSSLDPAVREITQTRELAERAIYYAQRTPNLLDMQIERLTLEIAAMPESRQLLANANSVAGAASVAGRVIGEFPGILAGEREAAVRQFMDAVKVETVTMRELVADVRAALEAGTLTSTSLDSTIHSFDQLVATLQKPASASSGSPGRPFNITEYTAAAAEIARAAGELRQVIAGVGAGSPALAQAAERASGTLQEAVDHAFWRILQLIGLLLVGSLGAALLYRGIARRWLA